MLALALATRALAGGLEDFDDQQDLDTLLRVDPVAESLGGPPRVSWSFPTRGSGYAYRVEADAGGSDGSAGASRAIGVFQGFGARDVAASVELIDWTRSSGDVALGIGLLRDPGAGRSDGYALWLRPATSWLELVRLEDEVVIPLTTVLFAPDPSRAYRLGLVRVGDSLEARVHDVASGALVAALSGSATTPWTDLEAGVIVLGSQATDVASGDFDRLFGGVPTADADHDGLADGDEVLAGSDPTLAAPGTPDPDGDGLVSDFELAAGTDPLVADSDGDGLSDGAELADGSFEPPRVIASGVASVRSIAAGDVDGDGDRDVVASVTQTGRIAWYQNLGGGSFAPEQLISDASPGAYDVLLVDVDGDADLDVVASSLFDGRLVWFENEDGQGDFGDANSIDEAFVAGIALEAGDFDGDGAADLVAALAASGTIAWYRNADGLGGYGAALGFASSAVAQDLAPADLDGDGDLDLLAAFASENAIGWYPNSDGLGGFGPRQLISDAVTGAIAVASADVDGDGDLDALSAAGTTGSVWWHENLDGAGGFGPPRPIATAVVGVRTLLPWDLDGDGDPDLVATCSGSPGTRWWENLDGKGSFGGERQIGASADLALAAIGDFDGDGVPDVARALGGPGQIVWYRQGSLSDPLDPDTDDDGLLDGFELAYGYAPRLADGNANGVVDGLDDSDKDGLSNAGEQAAGSDPRLADTDRDGLSDGAEVALGSDPLRVDSDGDGLLDGAEVALGSDPLDPDGDGDGLLDGFEVRFGFDPKAAGEQGQDPDGDGLTNLEEQARRTNPLDPDSDGDGVSDGDEVTLLGTDPAVADSDGDGLADGWEQLHGFDPLAADQDDDGIPDGRDDDDGDGLANAGEALAGTDPHGADFDGDGLLDGFELGSGHFGAQRVISRLANGARAVRAADLDGDGDADVLTASAIDDEIAWYENLDGQGGFGSQRLISTGADGACSVFAADLDGDGDLDVLSASELDDRVAWYENLDGHGSFGPARSVSLLTDGAASVFAADLDGDGDVDVLSASVNDGRLVWHENLDGRGGLFAERPIWQAPDGLRSVFAADLDGDGDPDVLSASWRSHEIGWHENGGEGKFSPRRVISDQAAAASAVFAADVDGDGDLDVLSASVFDDKVAWYENLDGSGTFGPERIVSSGVDEAWSAAAFDVDGDGDVDVLSASELADELAWFENADGHGGFTPGRVVTQQADGAAWVEAADLDGDGDADLVGVSSFDDEVAWYAQREVGDPRLADTDGDGLADGQEDPDADGLMSLVEQALGTDPLAADSDGDGFADGVEVEHDGDPLDPGITPTVQVPAAEGAPLAGLVLGLLLGALRLRRRP